MKLQKPPVAARATELGLPLMQPLKIRTDEFLHEVEQARPDAGVVIAYGRILPGRLLKIPKHGFLNVHASLLPKYRGAAPIQRAIEAGETVTGATIMRVDEELDHGPMLSVATIEIGPEERLPSVSRRLADAGAEALVRTLEALGRGTAVETQQDHSQATHAAKIEKDEGRITFAEPARLIFDRFRAFDPWPGVFFETRGETIRVAEMALASSQGSHAPRTVISIDQAVVVSTGEGHVRLEQLQRPGKPRAAAGDVARGLGWSAGAAIP